MKNKKRKQNSGKGRKAFRRSISAVALALVLAASLLIQLPLNTNSLTVRADDRVSETGDASAADSKGADTGLSTDQAEKTEKQTEDQTAADDKAEAENVSAESDPSEEADQASDGPAKEQKDAKAVNDSKDGQEFTYRATTDSGIQVTVKAEQSVLPCPGEEITLEVKDLTAAELDQNEKNLYSGVLSKQAENVSQVLEAQTDNKGEVTEKVIDPKTLETKDDAASNLTVENNADGTKIIIVGSDDKTQVTNYLVDVKLMHNGEEIEPTGEVDVEFQSEILKENGSTEATSAEAGITHLDTAEGKAVDTGAQIDKNKGTAKLKTESFSTYLVVKGGSGETDLKTALTEAGDGDIVQLNDDIQDAKKNSAYGINTGWQIEISKKVTLDLHGHRIWISGGNNVNGLFIVKNGGSLTITDRTISADNTHLTGEAITEGKKYGNIASMDTDRKTLTYYVTKSNGKVTKYTYSYGETGYIDGNISNSSGGVIYVESGGTLKLEKGLLTNTADNSHIIYGVNGSNVEITGGYVCGSNSTETGAGIYFSGSELKMSGGVIAANSSSNGTSNENSNAIPQGGGGICVNGESHGSTLSLSGGIISGNQVTKATGFGAGVLAQNQSTIDISGDAYITNNKLSGGNFSDGTGLYGGGGIAACGYVSNVINMSGGYVTGNESWLGGGGLFVGASNYNKRGTTPSELTLTKGDVSYNVADYGEGGGIRVSKKSTATINPAKGDTVNIKNNATHTVNDWGGGGIFVQQEGTLKLENAYIKENVAKGAGGGLAGCPTGNISIDMSRTAIFDNEAKKESYSGGTEGKKDDQDFLKPDFIKNGNKVNDLFIVANYSDGHNNSTSKVIAAISGDMLGGGSEDWTGDIVDEAHSHSASNNESVSYTLENPISSGETVYAVHLAALTANPSQTSKDNALKNARVFIMDNYSSVHGGGIMTNGNVEAIENTEIVNYPSIAITGKKSFPGKIQDGQFEFYLLSKKPKLNSDSWVYDEDSSRSVIKNDENGYLTSGKVNKDGTFTIDQFTLNDFDTNKLQAGDNSQKTFYLIEARGDDPSIKYDDHYYEINVTFRYTRTNEIKFSQGGSKTTYALSWNSVDIKKIDANSSDDTGTALSAPDFSLDSSLQNSPLNEKINILNGDNQSTFENSYKNVKLKIHKYDKDKGVTSALSGAVFRLLGEDKLAQISNDANGNDIQSLTTDENGNVTIEALNYGTYYLKEITAPAGYNTCELIKVVIDQNGVTYTIGSNDEINTAVVDTDNAYVINVPNTPGSKLPNTGGNGTKWIFALGAMLVLLSITYKFTLRQKRERREEQ